MLQPKRYVLQRARRRVSEWHWILALMSWMEGM